jgi:hypothetical protein
VLLGIAANQMLSRDDVVNAVAAGTFTWTSGAPSGWAGSHTMVNWSDFTAYVANNGSCTKPDSKPNGLMNLSQMQACAVNRSIVSATADPWLTFGGNYWPTQTGTATFSADSSGLAGEPGNAENVNSAAGTVTVRQQINPSTIVSGTTLVASAQLKHSIQSATGLTNDCITTDTITATGTATIAIENASGTSVVQQLDGGVSFSPKTAPYPVPSTGGPYYVAVTLQQATSSEQFYHVGPPPNNICTPNVTTVVKGNGYAIDITVSSH